MGKCQDTYKEVKTYERNNVILKVYIPELTEEERERRMKKLYKAAEELLREEIRLEMSKNEPLSS